jgi:hypothetical protein
MFGILRREGLVPVVLVCLAAMPTVAAAQSAQAKYYAREKLTISAVSTPAPSTPAAPPRKASCTLVKDNSHDNDVGSSNIGNASLGSYQEVLDWCETSFPNIKVCDAEFRNGVWRASAHSKGSQRSGIVSPTTVYYGGVCMIL